MQRIRNPRTGRFENSHRASARDGNFALKAALGIAGGISVGAALMYLLDPNQGEQRRQQIKSRAGDMAHGAWDTIHEHAADAGTMLASAAPMVGEKLMEHMHRAGDSADEARGAASDAASGWIESARSYLPHLPSMRDLRGRVSSMIPFQRQRRMIAPVAIATTAVGVGVTALAIGATAMYLFDPDRGRSRRAWIGQKASRAVRETGGFMRATGRHLANKGKGYYSQGRSAAIRFKDDAVAHYGSSEASESESQVPSI